MVLLLAAMAPSAQPARTASGAAPGAVALPAENQKLTQPGRAYWGRAVAISPSGRRLLVGNPNDATLGPEAGAVTTHVYDGETWVAEDTLYASDGAAVDRFGGALAIQNDVAVVGARRDDDAGEDAGAVYVFRHRAGTAGGWVQEQKLTASDAEANDLFGHAVAIYPNLIVVGTWGANAAYVFRFDGSSWVEAQVLSGTGLFGRSVDVTNGYVAVGAQGRSVGATLAAGTVYVYRETAGTFSEQDPVVSPTPVFNGRFGTSIALYSDRLMIVGEPGASVGGLDGAGKAHAFTYDVVSASWEVDHEFTATDPQVGAGFGAALAVGTSSALAVGAPYHDDDAGESAGAAYRFTRNLSVWDDGVALTRSDPAAGDRFGENLAQAADITSVGVPSDDEAGLNAGAVYLYGDYVVAPDPPRTEEQETVHDGAGWRLLSAPVEDLTVTDLAAVNLVQGIPAGEPAATYPAQYPGAGANLFTTYLGTGLASGYAAPTATDAVLVPGRGFWWYWYNENIVPPSGGTSRSYQLTEFSLAATGYSLYTDVAEAFAETADGFYMIGNPFSIPLRLGIFNPVVVGDDAITTSAGALSSSFYVYDPATSSYTVLTAADFAPDVLAVWQGAFAQITGTAGTDPTIVYRARATDFGADPPFYGRRPAEAGLALRLDGTLASGARVADRAANLRLLDDAEVGWDRHDLSELAPPNAERASLALVGERDGAPHRQGVLSLPTVLASEHVVPVAFLASEEGTFEVSWEAAVLPDGWTAHLRDRDTGAEADLAIEGAYAFGAQATDWTDRFEIVLTASAVAEESGPEAVTVGEPYPNPTAGGLRLGVAVAAPQRMTATVFDALGRRVAVVFDGEVSAGAQTLFLDAAALVPSVYVLRVTGDGVATTRRFVVAR